MHCFASASTTGTMNITRIFWRTNNWVSLEMLAPRAPTSDLLVYNTLLVMRATCRTHARTHARKHTRKPQARKHARTTQCYTK